MLQAAALLTESKHKNGQRPANVVDCMVLLRVIPLGFLMWPAASLTGDPVTNLLLFVLQVTAG